MTSFVHLEYSNQHAGVERFESAIASVKQIKRRMSGARALAMLLLSAIAAAVIVVAYEVMDSVAEGHLLVMWIGVWAAAFAALAVCASTARLVAANVKTSLDSWSRGVAAKRADERLWAMAKTDTRVMADLQCAMNRQDARDEGLTFVAPAPSVASQVLNAVAAGVNQTRAYKPLYI